MLEVEFAEITDDGRVRDHNEDFFGHYAPSGAADARLQGWLFALADGVGGHDRGEVASRLAVETLLSGFARERGVDSHAAQLEALVQKANERVYEEGSTAPGERPMATTIVACALRHDKVTVTHVGDSRCYLLRGLSARQLTRDHTVVAEQVRLGLLSEREAAESQASHILSRSVGVEMFARPESSQHTLLPGDILLLCSDGLHNAVDGLQMARIAQDNYNLARAAARMVDIANERDGGDNITIQLIRICSVEAVGMYRGRPYRLH